MADFQFAGLDPSLLEKVITKLDSKSYFRMRQTCRGMDEFIRASRNISVHMWGEKNASYCVEFDRKEPHQLRWFDGSVFDLDGTLPLNTREMDIEVFYGIRLDVLHLPGQSFGQFNQLCNFLREHRITCEELDMPKWTKKDCETILNIVTPVSAVLDSKCSNRYEALFQSKTLEQVVVYMFANEVNTAAPRLLSTFPYVSIRMSCLNSTYTFQVIKKLIDFLYRRPPSDLRKFSLTIRESFLQFYDGWEEQFLGLGIPIGEITKGEYFVMVPNGFSIMINGAGMIYYQVNLPDCVV